MQGRGETHSLDTLGIPERALIGRDANLASLIRSQGVRWPLQCNEDALWGLLRIVVAQQISTGVACRIAEQIRSAYPELSTPSPAALPEVKSLQRMGLPQRRAQCCLEIVRRSDDIRAEVRKGQTWEEALAGIKGIGPWTLAVFRIMVLREPDVLPTGDIGLRRAIDKVYGPHQSIETLAKRWRPFRSVACWYLWRTLGNQQLG